MGLFLMTFGVSALVLAPVLFVFLGTSLGRGADWALWKPAFAGAVAGALCLGIAVVAFGLLQRVPDVLMHAGWAALGAALVGALVTLYMSSITRARLGNGVRT